MQFSVSRLLREDHEEKMVKNWIMLKQNRYRTQSLLIGDFTNGPFACFKRNTIPVKTTQAASSISRTLQVLKSTMDTQMWCRSCGFP